MKRQIARSVLGVLLLVGSALATDVSGLWTGQAQGGRGTEDVAFRFQVQGTTFTGKLFGDEFDQPVTEGTITGDQIKFFVVTTNYYSGAKTRFLYTGTIKGGEMELVRERVASPDDRPGNRQQNFKQTLKLKRLT
jgi:hypothetical protein